MTPLDTVCTNSYSKCSFTSTVSEIFDVDNIAILVSRLGLLTLPTYAPHVS